MIRLCRVLTGQACTIRQAINASPEVQTDSNAGSDRWYAANPNWLKRLPHVTAESAALSSARRGHRNAMAGDAPRFTSARRSHRNAMAGDW